MTGVPVLDWAVLTVSLFNTMLLLWLSLTVLLTAERRTPGVWMTGGGLLMGGLFFISHTTILGHGLLYVSRGLDFWWRAGWVPVIALPYSWYAHMLWYAGFWDDRSAPLHRRQRWWFVATTLFAVGLLGLMAFANALPSYWQVRQFDIAASPAIAGIPILILAYPIYILLCTVLSLDALRRPGPSTRVMGDLARRRARPWLIAATVVLVLVSLLVGLIMLVATLNTRRLDYTTRDITTIELTVAWFDLTIASLIGGVIILLGQAIVSYEVFTGKALPRRGFIRHWHRAIILAAGYSAIVGGSLAQGLRPIYSLLLTTTAIVVFYALLSWRTFAERERAIDNLRPFVTSQRLYEHLLAARTTPEHETPSPFHALCDQVLNAQVAYLIALGPLAPLAGPPLTHPPEAMSPPPSIARLASQFTSPKTMCTPLDPAKHGGATWAVPLWSERGLIGVFLLGEKRDGGLYTQEEIEIARASGERLIDTQASTEMARRLMSLQRERLAQSQVLDQQTRRVLHDDILPRLHAATLALSDQASHQETVSSLADAHRQISDLLHEMPTSTIPSVSRLGLVDALRRTVNDPPLDHAFDSIVWEVEEEGAHQAEAIPALAAQVLFYAAREAMRNAAQHGRPSESDRPLSLRVAVAWRTPGTRPGSAGLEITIEDDGVGIGSEEQPTPGSGQGLALHSTMMAVVGGTLTVDSVPGAYTRILLFLPQGAWQT